MRLKETIHYAFLYKRRNLRRLYRTDVIFFVLFLLVGIFGYFSLWLELYFNWLSGQLGVTFDLAELYTWKDLVSLIKVLLIASISFWALIFGYLLYYLRHIFRLELAFDESRIRHYLKKTRDGTQLMKEFVISRFSSVFLLYVLGSLISLFLGEALTTKLVVGMELPSSIFRYLNLFASLLLIALLLILIAEILFLAWGWKRKNK